MHLSGCKQPKVLQKKKKKKQEDNLASLILNCTNCNYQNIDKLEILSVCSGFSVKKRCHGKSKSIKSMVFLISK